ncbi:NlpC/P60 family protein [Hyphomicrobium sp. CS1BSMeth3]|uniref:NlpC/P60 family protein n=1 Tax=Hyphomicrobium sp. CS1BSMeth3 TaxID=1892844 RepID=UPI000931BEAC|nr:NlpC/P60 family protein [Hyphomicrobium sp. CS1BSMeth3]
MSYSRDDIVAEARRWIGTPYHHQASLRGIGTDCLGLVRGVWRALHGTEAEAVPAYSRDWAEATGVETMLAAARRHLIERDRIAAEHGDILIFRYRADAIAKHVGILSGPLTMIHAIEGRAVAEVPFTPWWRRHTAAVFSFPGIRS